MVPKLKFGSTILVVLLGLACSVGSLQVFSPPTEAQENKMVRTKLPARKAVEPKEIPPLPSSTAKLRNPFVPMQQEANKHDSGKPNVSQSQVPNASTLPVLRGILEQSGRQFAIIEYNNKSHLCAIGNNVSSYTLTGLTAFSAFLEHNGQVIEIKLGKKL